MMPLAAQLATWPSHVVRLAMVMHFLLTDEPEREQQQNPPCRVLGDLEGKGKQLERSHMLAPFS